MALRLVGMLILSVLAGCGKAPVADPTKPESYTHSWTVEPAPGGAEQQLALPAETLLALKTSDLSDLRLFDSTGRAVPLACFKEAEERSQVVSLKSYPVLADAAAPGGWAPLVIAPDRAARIAGRAAQPGNESQIATLIDTRAVGRRVLALQFRTRLPPQQPVTFRAAASSDLKTWVQIAEKTLFRAAVVGDGLEEAQMPFSGISLKDRYLQISWGSAAGVAVIGARVTVGLNKARPTLMLGTDGVRLTDTHELHFTLPAGHYPDSVEVGLAGGEGAMPVQLFSRGSAEAPWQSVVGTTLRGGSSPSNQLALDGAIGREFRLVVDPRASGFAAPPQVTLHFGEVTMLARFNGKPPYRLAAGLAQAPRSLLTAADIVSRGNPADLPQARVVSGAAPRVNIAAEAAGGPLGDRQAALWFVLFAGLAVLAVAAVRLLRSGRAARA